MLPWTQMISKAGKFLSDNSPVIFTAIGVTGAATTAYLTGKASFKAARVIAEAEADGERRVFTEPINPGDPDPGDPLSTKEKIALVWTLYIPAAASGALTIGSMICATQIGTRRAAALASAYKLSEQAWEEYKGKIIETIGEKKEQKARDQVAQDQVNRNPVGTREVILTGNGEVLCYDAFTGRYFKSDMPSLKKAQNDLNHQILSTNFASLSDFYDLVGLGRTEESEEIGWNSDDLLELEISTTLSENDVPCLSLEFNKRPSRSYFRFH